MSFPIKCEIVGKFDGNRNSYALFLYIQNQLHNAKYSKKNIFVPTKMENIFLFHG